MLEHFRPRRVLSPAEVEQGLRYVMYDGASAQIMTTLTGGAFLIAFALLLGASPFLIGVIGALQPLTQILQIPTIYFVERVGYRKLLVVSGLIISRLFCFVLMVLPWWQPPSYRLPALMVALFFFFGFGTISGVAWNPWVRDLIPEDRLSTYMAKRLAVTTAIGALLGLAGAFGIDWWQRHYEPIDIYPIYFALGG